MTVAVQIYTMQSVEESRAVAALGIEHIGVTPSDRGLPGEISTGVARTICEELRGLATSVALSVESDLAAIETMTQDVRPDILHLCGPPGAVSPQAVAALRETLPGTAIMQAIAVTGPDAVDAARAYAPHVDFLILDSVAPDIAGIGAAGVTHDWSISAAIVAAVDVPVVLAGGLGPHNVAAAITAVRPWGVDSLTHTSEQLGGGRFRKDLDAVRRFAAAAREATT